MTKIRSKSKAAKTKKVSAVTSAVASRLAVFTSQMQKKRYGVALIFLALLIASFLLMESYDDMANYAMLYIFANNGKLSGRADGNVYQKNGRVRAFRNPALVQNSYTGAARAIFGSNSSGWNSLTQDEMQTWNNAEGFFTTDRFGRQIVLKGKELYTRLNSNLDDIGSSNITTAPTPAAVSGITSLAMTADVSDTEIELTYTPTPTDAGVVHKVFATGLKSNGAWKPKKSAFRFIGTIAVTTASPQDIYAIWNAKFGSLVAGKKIFVKLVPVNRLTGQDGAAIVSSTVVVA